MKKSFWFVRYIVCQLTALLFLAGLYSCSKQQDQIQEPGCKQCLLISEKRADQYSKALKIDTLWNDMVCGALIDSVKAQKPDLFFNCALNQWEYLYYVVK